MRTVLLFIILMIISAKVVSQSFNQEIKTEEGTQLLTGKINQQRLETAPYDAWFSKNYTNYTPNQNIIDSIKKDLSSYTIKAFLGTWCGDSKREIPRLYKALNASDFPLERLTTIAVQRNGENYKQSIGGEQEGLNIHRVPTIIFYKNNKEVNRIVESPINSFEEDIKSILAGSYTSNYISVTHLDSIINNHGHEYLQRRSKKLVKKLKKTTTSYKELNTYAIVLFYNNRIQTAIEVLKLNISLYPKKAKTYSNIANMLEEVNKINEAISYYEQSLLYAENEKISTKINELKMSL